MSHQAKLPSPSQRGETPTGGTINGRQRQAAVPERRAGPETAPWLALDFSKIPLFPAGRASRPRASSGFGSPKLAIGHAGDPLEHEANRIADQMIRALAAVDSKAYILGSHVVFAAGQYAPHRQQGKHLLAHELTHVFQQPGGEASHPTSSGPKAVLQRQMSNKGEQIPAKTKTLAEKDCGSGEAEGHVQICCMPHGEAMFNLGQMCWLNEAGLKHKDAMDFYRRARDAGYLPARQRLEELGSRD